MTNAIARFCLANSFTLYGTFSTISATSADDCAYQAVSGDFNAFGWASDTQQCELFSSITGFLEEANETWIFYLRKDDYSGSSCASSTDLIQMIHDAGQLNVFWFHSFFSLSFSVSRRKLSVFIQLRFNESSLPSFNGCGIKHEQLVEN